MKTKAEIDKLKEQWKSDPIWDLYESTGFEDHREELKTYQEEFEKQRDLKLAEKEAEIDQKAVELGAAGLYRMLLKHEEILQRHAKAIDALADGDSRQAYRILVGIDN